MSTNTLHDHLIHAANLQNGHTLSWTDQPYFRDLTELMRSANHDLVIFVGAGVSMDSALPSWKVLVDHLADACLTTDALREQLELLGPAALDRRANMLLYQSGKTIFDRSNIHHLRTALYVDQSRPTPGDLSLAIARLTLVYPGRVSLITTNFDPLLETALNLNGDLVQSFSFDDWDSWVLASDQEHRLSVMHLHGLVRPDITHESDLYPVVFSESDFLIRGPLIQDKLTSYLKDKAVLIVGASLTDPNLVGPLAVLSNRHKPDLRFATLVPQLNHPSSTVEECCKWAVWEAKALKDALHFKPILLKTYSQVTQLVTELSLASYEPKRYRRPCRGLPKGSSLHYGTRLENGLNSVYKALGANSRTWLIPQDGLVSLSKRLHVYTFGPDGPVRRLRQIRDNHPGDCCSDENIGIFLWLREPSGTNKAEFGLRFIVSSAYAHWQTWVPPRVIKIEESAQEAAARAAYFGQPVFGDIGTPQSQSWKGALALPFVIKDTALVSRICSTALDALNVGAISIRTDRAINRKSAPEDRSGMAVMFDNEMKYLVEAVENMVTRLLRGA